MNETLGKTYSREKLHSISGPVKLECKLYALKIQWWDRQIAVTDIPIQHGKKWKRKGVTSSSNFEL